MAIDVTMPQMGESIAEGTIVRWIKKVGDTIDKDEPLFEISTDKVDAEIPSPGAGVLIEILTAEGETVPINSVVARIGAAGEKSASLPAGASAQAGRAENAGGAETSSAKAAEPQADGSSASTHKAAPTQKDEKTPPPAAAAPAPQREATLEDVRRQRSSPVAGKIRCGRSTP